MRYLIYASRSKVDMLHPQLPGRRRGTRSTTVGLDWKLAKAEQAISTTHDQRFIEQLAEVEDWIYLHDQVGTIEQPDAWIHFRGELIAANFTESPHRAGDDPIDMAQEAVIFAGRDSVGNRLLLGGSGCHLTVAQHFGSGDRTPLERTLYYSWSVGLLRLFETYRDDIEHPVMPHDRPLPADQAGKVVAQICDDMLRRRFQAQSLGTCDVLAKRLATYPVEDTVTTLATPLSVSMLD